MTTIFLARHGQSEYNRDKRITGQLDPPLTLKGRRQARGLAALLRDTTLSAIYTSPLVRARETAAPAAADHRLTPVVRDELREMRLGIMEGRFRDQRDPEARALWKAREADKLGFMAPEGETWEELDRRVRPCVQEIIGREHAYPILIVGHRNVNRVVLSTLLGWPLAVALSATPSSRNLYCITLGAVREVRRIPIDIAVAGAP